jgi:hypothetical protein
MVSKDFCVIDVPLPCYRNFVMMTKVLIVADKWRSGALALR